VDDVAGGSTSTASAALVVGVLVAGALLGMATALLSRRVVAILVGAIVVVALPAQTVAAFSRYFSIDGTAGRPLTLDQGAVFNWIDRALGPDADVTAVPYPTLPGELTSSIAYWWDVQFWNQAVTRTAWSDGRFGGTPSTFPKLDLRFDERTGFANLDETPYVAQAVGDTRFYLAGRKLLRERDVHLIEAARPWRAEWLARGLDADGWTRPGQPATIRVFPAPGQQGPVTRSLAVLVRGPADAARPFRVSYAGRTQSGTATPNASTIVTPVCVPHDGFADVRLEADGSSPVYGEMKDNETFAQPREAGVFLGQISLADEIGPPC
jgi:hypothetical protein